MGPYCSSPHPTLPHHPGHATLVSTYFPLCPTALPIQGVNKAVILGLVDELLSKKEVNIW